MSSPGDVVEDGVRIVRLRSREVDAPTHERRFGQRLFPHLLRERYDAIHSIGASDAAAAAVCRRLGRARRTVFTNLGLPDKNLWRARPDHRYHEFVVRTVDVYACLSHYAASVFEQSYGRQASVTSGGVNLARFAPDGDRAPEPTLLFAGSFDDPMKNVPLLLEAMSIIVRHRPDARLWLVGPGDANRHLADVTPQVRARVEVLPGGDTELAKWYRRSWVTVLPSKWESFAMVLVESLACGTPIVATRHSASPERVVPGSGLLAAPDDPVSLADACLKALELTHAPGIIDRCRAAAAPYDWDAQIAMYQRIYDGSAPLPAATVAARSVPPST